MTKHTREIEILLRTGPARNTEPVPAVRKLCKLQTDDQYQNLQTNPEPCSNLTIPNIHIDKEIQIAQHKPYYNNHLHPNNGRDQQFDPETTSGSPTNPTQNRNPR